MGVLDMTDVINAAWRKLFLLCSGHRMRGAILLSALALAGCQGDLYTNLDEKQANEIVATLLNNYIPAERVVAKGNTFTVRVDEKHYAEAVGVLKESGLPREHFATLGETFKRDGLFSSPLQERASMIFALSQELSHTISEIDGVRQARVHLVLPENDPLRQQFIPSSASVVVYHDASAPVANFVPQIKMVVANGVSGLSYDKVSVALFPVEKKPQAHKGQPELTPIMGLLVSPESAAGLVWLLTALLVMIVVLGGALSVIYLRQSRRVYQLPTLAKVERS